MLENKYKFKVNKKDLNKIKENNHYKNILIDVYLLGKQVEITREDLDK